MVIPTLRLRSFAGWGHRDLLLTSVSASRDPKRHSQSILRSAAAFRRHACRRHPRPCFLHYLHKFPRVLHNSFHLARL